MRSAANEAAMARRADVGVLFVHGIGRQAKGAALEEGANAIQAAIRSETKFKGNLHGEPTTEDGKGDPQGKPLTTEFGPVDLAAPGPSPATANLFVRADSTSSPQRWLLAESHWADAFRSPGLARTLAWILVVSPVLLLSRAVEGAVGAVKSWWWLPLHWWRIVLAVLWVILVAPVSVVLVPILTLTVLLRFLIPIQFITDLLGRLEVIVTAYLGDSYLFTGNEASRAAIATRVAADISWLTARADRVVVVSHSQGAAVTALALASCEPVDTLITFGAGIGQLDWLRKTVAEPKQLRRRFFGFLTWLGYIALAVLVPATVLMDPTITDSLMSSWQGWLTLFALLGLIPQFVIAWKEQARSARPRVLTRDLAASITDRSEQGLAVRWWDVWASADPVPGGPSTSYSYPDVYSFRVFNRGNFVTDHSTYYRNADEFGGLLLLAVLQPPEEVLWSSQRGSDEAQTADFLLAALPLRFCLRQRRGRWLEAWRAGLAALAVAVMIRWIPQLAEGVGGSIEWLARVFPTFAEILRAVSNPALRVALAAFVVALGALAVYGVSLLLWQGWARVEQRIVNSRLRLDELEEFDAEVRVSVSQLSFIAIVAAATTLAIAAAAFVLFGDVEAAGRWAASLWNPTSLLWLPMLIPASFVTAGVLRIVFPNWVETVSKKADLTLQRSLPVWVVRDPLTFAPFRHQYLYE